MGWPVAHSKSPLIHRFWLAKLNIDGDYGRFPVDPKQLGEALGALSALGLRGVNLTVPHKIAAFEYLDIIDELAGETGAVNTIVVENGRLIGHNTDVAGVSDSLHHLYNLEEDLALTLVQIIGAGGAARAAVVGARRLGYSRFEIAARSIERATSVAVLARTVFGRVRDLVSLGPIVTELDGTCVQPCSYIIINATTLGMLGNDPVPIDLSVYPPDTIVFDMVYSPLETPLLAAARASNLRTIDGLEMLVAQAAQAFHLFFGRAAPREYDSELRALLMV